MTAAKTAHRSATDINDMALEDTLYATLQDTL